MTIPANISPRIEYLGNGSAYKFSFPFRAVSQNDVSVVIRGVDGARTTLASGVDYSLSYNPFPLLGGEVTLLDNGQTWLSSGLLASGFSITISYVINPRQLARFRDLGPLAPVEFEKALDQLVMQMIALSTLDENLPQQAEQFFDLSYSPQGPFSIANGESIPVLPLLRQHVRVFGVNSAVASSQLFGNDSSLFRDGMEIVVEGISDTGTLDLIPGFGAFGFMGNGGIILRRHTMITFIYNASLQRFIIKSLGAW